MLLERHYLLSQPNSAELMLGIPKADEMLLRT